MTNNLDTLLTALYVDLDDRVLPALGWSRDHRPGRKPALSDAELACLAAAQHLLGIDSERRWIRYAHAHLAGMFPHLPGQSGYGKRLRALGGLLAAVITELARGTASWHDLLRLVDSTPLPCAASRETVKRSDLAGHAGYGYCASHSRFFWGFRLYLITTAEGMPIIWGLAHPGLGEREVVTALLARDHDLIRAGQVILGDKGFAGRDFETFITGEPGAHLIRPDRKDEPARFGTLARHRQWIEAIIDTLKGQLTLEHHGGRTLAGVYARVAARLLALAAAIWHNWHIGASIKRSLIAYDHSAPRGALSYPRFSREELGGRFLGLMAYLDPKGEGDNSMPGKQRLCPGVWNGALRDPRNMAKAGLPEPQSPAGLNRNLPERRLKPVPCPASAISGGRCILRDAERCPVRVFKEMSGEPKLRYHV